MRVRVLQDNEEIAYLACDSCIEVLLDSDDSPMEIDKLVQVAQAHAYACPGVMVPSEGVYHGQCGDMLFHFRGMPETHRCARCNRIIPEAEQIEHSLTWLVPPEVADSMGLGLQPSCTCGWKSTVHHITMHAAQSEWGRHPKMDITWRAS